MLVRLVGYKNLDFTDDKGNPVKGTQLFANFPEDDVVGFATDKFFIKPHIQLPELTPGNDYDVEFGRKNKILGVTPATSQAVKLNIKSQT